LAHAKRVDYREHNILARFYSERLPEEDPSAPPHDQLVLSARQTANDRIVRPSLEPIGSAANNHFDVGLSDVDDHLAARQRVIDDPSQYAHAQQTGCKSFDDSAANGELGQYPQQTLREHE
jgi:hypothetical protein